MKETYWMDPKTVKFDQKIATFNKPKDNASYLALKKEIEINGQETPILIRNDRCGDGRHRTMIAIELGRQVLALDVDAHMTDFEFVRRCNRDTFTGRNDSPTQKAIKAYLMTKDYGCTDYEAILYTGLPKDAKTLGYARTIDSSPLGRKLNILNVLLSGEAINIGGSFTKSVDTAKRLLKKAEESEIYKEVLSELAAPLDYNIDYNRLIGDSEILRTEFWNAQAGTKQDLNVVLIKWMRLAMKYMPTSELVPKDTND